MMVQPSGKRIRDPGMIVQPSGKRIRDPGMMLQPPNQEFSMQAASGVHARRDPEPRDDRFFGRAGSVRRSPGETYNPPANGRQSPWWL